MSKNKRTRNAVKIPTESVVPPFQPRVLLAWNIQQLSYRAVLATLTGDVVVQTKIGDNWQNLDTPAKGSWQYSLVECALRLQERVVELSSKEPTPAAPEKKLRKVK